MNNLDLTTRPKAKMFKSNSTLVLELTLNCKQKATSVVSAWFKGAITWTEDTFVLISGIEPNNVIWKKKWVAQLRHCFLTQRMTNCRWGEGIKTMMSRSFLEITKMTSEKNRRLLLHDRIHNIEAYNNVAIRPLLIALTNPEWCG